jgi:hypothetical protein
MSSAVKVNSLDGRAKTTGDKYRSIEMKRGIGTRVNIYAEVRILNVKLAVGEGANGRTGTSR